MLSGRVKRWRQRPIKDSMSGHLKSALVLALLAALAIPAGAQAGCPGAGKRPAELTVDEARDAVQCAINQRRRLRGLPRLKANRRLERAAQRHSQDMNRSNYFSHNSPAGGFVQRIAHTGYLSGSRSWGIGENLRWGIGSLGTPRMAVIAWMQSPAHRRTLLRRRYRHLGIGVAFGAPFDGDDSDTAIYTADFGYR